MSPAEFCREIEAYLCRKNDGHLIRIVGPVFGKVSGWAEQGIPLKVAFRGIDRYFDRQHAKAPHASHRRPVQVQFCEADILDAFDDWRRAVGVSARSLHAENAEHAEDAQAPSDADGAAGARARSTSGAGGVAGVGGATDAPSDVSVARRKASLQTHIDRAMARLTQRRVEAGVASALGDAIDRILAQLDTLRADAKGARNDTRARLVAALASLDRALLDAAVASLDAPAVATLRTEARRELEPFQSRMPPDALARAVDAATDRLVRERGRLPILRVDD
jgi:hypothetical protein